MKENQTSCIDLLLEVASGIPLGREAFTGLVSALALVLRGWHLGDLSPFGVPVSPSRSRVLKSPCKTSRASVDSQR